VSSDLAGEDKQGVDAATFRSARNPNREREETSTRLSIFVVGW
jgi:hypothetical protein